MSNIFQSDWEYTSVCEVVESNSTGELMLSRLGDIDRNGVIRAFVQDDLKPVYFGNRPQLWHRNGPSELGTVAVWDWSALPNNTDPTRDYVKTNYNYNLIPTEVIILSDMSDTKSLIEKIKKGINYHISTERIGIAFYNGKGIVTCLICTRDDLEEAGTVLKLKEEVISIPLYIIQAKDIIRLSNEKRYLRNIELDEPTDIIHTKDNMNIVGNIILSRSNWNLFKQAGKTRAEWKIVKDFLSQLDSTSLVEEISNSCQCSEQESEELLQKFIANATKYVDGMSFEDQILASVISANKELQEQCNDIVRSEWEQSHADKVKAAEAELETVRKDVAEWDEKHQKLIKEYGILKNDFQTLNENIENRRKLAEEVEAQVAEKIQKAKENASGFIADMAFFSAAKPESSSQNIQINTESIVNKSRYIQSVILNEIELEDNDSWESVITTVSFELMQAGVIDRYAHAMAAYMYIAFKKHFPLLIAGPNAADIVDAFSAGLFGRTAGILELSGEYNSNLYDSINDSGDKVVKIINPFNHEWINRLPEIVTNKGYYSFAIYPFVEDLQIEPRSTYSYMIPIVTDLLINKLPDRHFAGGRLKDNYSDFALLQAKNIHSHTLNKLHMIPLVKNNLQTLLTNMHAMIKDENPDYDVLFALLPYAVVTNQSDTLIEAIQNQTKLNISADLKKLITEVYGVSNE